jgi:hypothetical protein
MNNEINEIPVKYITDYKILPGGEKEIVMHLIPGMEDENENLNVDKYLNVANSDIAKILNESKNIPNDPNPPQDNLQEYEFNIFRILQNLDNVLQFIETDTDFKQSNPDFNKNELLDEIKRMETLLLQKVVNGRDTVIGENASAAIKGENTTAERAGEIDIEEVNPVNRGDNLLKSGANKWADKWVNNGANKLVNNWAAKGGNKK